MSADINPTERTDAMTEADSISIALQIATLLVTLTIPIILYVASRRDEKTRQKILTGQHQLLSAMRFDDLVKQAETFERREDLNLVLQEAKDLEDELGLSRVLDAYWRNPAVPLSGFDQEVDARAIDIMRQHLSPKLERTTWSRQFDELGGLINRAESNECESLGIEVSDWIFEQFDNGNNIHDGRIRELLHGVKDPSVFYSLLHPLDEIHRRLPTPAIVNVLTGVCLAYLDRIRYFNSFSTPSGGLGAVGSEPHSARRTTEVAHLDLSTKMLSVMASLLHRNRLIGFGELNDKDCSIMPEVSYAVVVAVAGATSFTDDWMAHRALQGIQHLSIRRDKLGTWDREWQFGRAKFEEHQPSLLAQFPIGDPG